MRAAVLTALLCVFSFPVARAQDSSATEAVPTGWLIDQAIPGMNWTTLPGGTHFAFEWEATPVLYSFGISKLVSPWKFFFVRPPARFTGSVELIVAGQLFTSSYHGSVGSFSATLLGHIPVIEYGEDLALNLGVARQWYRGLPVDFGVAGVSVLFGFVEYNIRYAPNDRIWIHELAFRMF